MIEKIILAITHSDDCTDYLFLTAGLANTYHDYDRKQGLSALTLFDVVDTLSITR